MILAILQEGGDVLENLPLRLACCAAAQAISVRILVMRFSLLFPKYALCKLRPRGWLVFSCLVAVGILFIVALLLTVFLEVALPICAGEQSNSLLVSRLQTRSSRPSCRDSLASARSLLSWAALALPDPQADANEGVCGHTRGQHPLGASGYALGAYTYAPRASTNTVPVHNYAAKAYPYAAGA